MERERTYYVFDGDVYCIYHDELLDARYGCRICPKEFDS